VVAQACNSSLDQNWNFTGATPPSPSPSASITSVSVSCSPTIAASNQTPACTPVVTGTGNFSNAVTWSVSPTTVGNVSGAGIFTPAATLTVTITATSTQDSTKSGSATVTETVATTVPVSATITSVSVACASASILTTQTVACTPTVIGTGNYSTSVSWSVSPTSAGTITGAGIFTPTSAGAATITATSSEDSTKSSSATVTVTAAASLPSPLLAVGLKKTVSGYSGPAMRIQRLSDNAQADINFTASGNVDTSAILAFLGSTSTLGYVVTLYDQSGNGYNLTQTTVANAPTIQLSAPTTITTGGVTYTTARSVITSSDAETPMGGPGYWNIPSGVSTNINSTTTVEAYSPDYSGGEGFEEYNLGNSASTTFDLYRYFGGAYGMVESGGAYLTYGSGYYWRQQPTVVALASNSSTAPDLYIDGVAYSGISGVPSATLSGGTLLGGIRTSYASYSNFLAFEVFNSTLTQSEVQTISTALIPRTAPTVNIVGDGDSITEGHCATYGRAALRYAEPSLSVAADITNIAMGGTTTSNPIYNSGNPTVAGSHYGTLFQSGYATNILYLAIGTNDIHLGATGAATWTNVETALTNAKSLGYKTAVASIIHESGETTGQANEVNNFNTLLYAAAGGSLVDVVVDYAANANLSPPAFAATYSCDGTHPNDAGYATMGTIAAPALNALIGLPQ